MSGEKNIEEEDYCNKAPTYHQGSIRPDSTPGLIEEVGMGCGVCGSKKSSKKKAKKKKK